MPSAQCHSYNLNFELEIVAEAEAVKNNREIAHEYGISESMEKIFEKMLCLITEKIRYIRNA